MNLNRLAYCGALLLLAMSSAPAATVRIVGMQGRIDSESLPPAVFGNREEGIDLEIESPDAQSGALCADLFQISRELALPLAKDVPLQKSVSLTGKIPLRLHVSIKFPEVKQRAEILVHFLLVASSAQTVAGPLGDLRFEVFPSSVTKELVDLLQPSAVRTAPVVLFGSGRKFHQFLSDLRIPFDDNGAATPDQLDPSRTYFGESTADQPFQETQAITAGGRVVVFSPDPSLPAGIYEERKPTGIFIRVTLPLLDNLTDDPRAQLGLIKMLNLLTAPL